MATNKDKAKSRASKRGARRSSTTNASVDPVEELRKKTSMQRAKAKYAKAIDALKDQ